MTSPQHDSWGFYTEEVRDPEFLGEIDIAGPLAMGQNPSSTLVNIPA